MAKLLRNGRNLSFRSKEILNFEFTVQWGKYCPSENKLCSEQIRVDANNRWEGKRLLKFLKREHKPCSL